MSDDHGHGGGGHNAGHGDAHESGHGKNHGGTVGNREPVIFALILGGILLVPIALLFILKLPPILAALIVILLLATALMAPRIVEIKQYEKGVQFDFGKFQKVLPPGWHWHFPLFQTVQAVDMRTQVLDIEPQDVITAENITLKIEAAVYVRIEDPKKAVLEVKDVHKAASELIHGELRARIGKLSMNEVIENTEGLNHDLEAALEKVEHAWGIHSVSVEITDISMPKELEESFLKQKEAGQYKAKLETEAQARRDAIQTIKDATESMSDSTLAYLYMETLKKVADGRASKILFPIELTNLARALSQQVKATANSGKSVDPAALADQLVTGYLQAQKNRQKPAAVHGKNATKTAPSASTSSTTVEVRTEGERPEGTAA